MPTGQSNFRHNTYFLDWGTMHSRIQSICHQGRLSYGLHLDVKRTACSEFQNRSNFSVPENKSALAQPPRSLTCRSSSSTSDHVLTLGESTLDRSSRFRLSHYINWPHKLNGTSTKGIPAKANGPNLTHPWYLNNLGWRGGYPL